MSYQGIILALTVTVAIGAAIYNYFNANREGQYRYDERPRQSDDFDCNYTFNPRSGTNPRSRKNKRKEEECTICLCNAKSNIKILNCGHIFHISCIDTWFKQDKSCPNCRSYQ